MKIRLRWAAVLLATAWPLSAAATPNANVGSWATGSTAGMATGRDDRFVVIAAGGSGLRIIDLSSFDLITMPLDVLGHTVNGLAITGATTECILTVHSDGTIAAIYYDDIALWVDDGLDPLVVDATVTAGDNLIDAAADPTSDLTFVIDNTAQTVVSVDAESVTPGGAVFVGHSMNAITTAVTNTGLRTYATTSDGYVADVSNGVLTLLAPLAGQNPDLIDITTASIGTGQPQLFVLDATNDQVHQYDTAGNLYVGSYNLPAGSTPVAITTVGTSGGDQIVVAYSNPDEVRFYDASGFAESETVAVGGAPVAAMAEPIGYTFVGTGTQVEVITDNPWLEDASVTPDPVTDPAADITFTFTSNVDLSAWNLYVGGAFDVASAQATSGSVRSGTATAGQPQTVTVPGTEVTLDEGKTPFWIVGRETGTSLIGHAGGYLTYDVPPPTVSGFHVGYGDGRIFVEWEVIDAEDVASYEVNFGTDAAATTGVGSLTSPATVDQPDPVIPGTTLRYRIEPVPNGTEVFAYVVAIDAAGNRSSATPILSATAQETSGACDQNPQPCGFAACDCHIAPQGRGAPRVPILLTLLGVLGIGVLRIRRARGLVALLAVTLVGAATLPRNATAAEKDTSSPHTMKGWDEVHESHRWGTFSLGGGIFLADNDILTNIYGDTPAVAELRLSGSLYHIVDLGIAGGASQWQGRAVGNVDGTLSDDIVRLTMFPITGTLVLRGDFFENQPVVPFVGAGLTWIEYNEREVFDDRTVHGTEYGLVYTGGLMILLDMLEPGRARDLDRYWGVNDIFLELRADRFEIDRLGKGAALDLSGWRLTGNFLFAY